MLGKSSVGSVTRTITEAVGREIATVYEQVNLAYLSAFVDTATGASLDYVVEILDVTRKTAEFAEGLVTFFRAAGLDGNITIPAGTRLAASSGTVVFVSTQPRTLQRGQVRGAAFLRFAHDLLVLDASVVAETDWPWNGRTPAALLIDLEPYWQQAFDERAAALVGASRRRRATVPSGRR